MTASGNFNRDKLESCKQTYDLWDVIGNRPQHSKPHVEPASDRIIDSVESIPEDELPKEEIEKEILEEFRQNGYNLPDEKLVLLGRIGKYLFFTIALPPYMIVFALPKWVLTTAIPAMVNQIGKGFEALGQRMSNAYGWVRDGVLSVISAIYENIKSFEQKKANTIQKTENDHLSFLGFIGRGIYMLRHVFYDPVAAAVKWSIDAANAALHWIRRMPTKIHQLIQESYEAVKRQISNVLDLGKSGLQAAYDLIHRNIIQPPSQWLYKKIDLAGKGLENIVNWAGGLVNRAVDSLKRAVMTPINVIQGIYQGALDRINNAMSDAKRNMTDWLKKKADDVANVGRGIRDRVHSRIKAVTDGIADKVNHVAEAAKNYIQQTFDGMMGWFWNIPQKVYDWAPLGIIRWMIPKVKFVKNIAGTFVRAGEGIALAARKVVHHVSAIGKNIAEKVRQWYKVSKKAYDWMKNKALYYPRRFVKKIKRIGGAIARFMRRKIRWLRRLIVWLKILCRYWMKRVREISSELGGWFKLPLQ